MDSGDGIADLKNRAHAQYPFSAYFMAAGGRYYGVLSTAQHLSSRWLHSKLV